jgi:aerobic-type carbon monoxide dehydrogenase small subunit (CoxS/CutS family)
MSLTALLDQQQAPSDDEIRTTLDGHLCRCTGYRGILKAAHSAVKANR